MLSNAVLLGLLPGRQLVVYSVKCFAPRFVTGRQLIVYAVKCCATRFITGETIGGVCCQILFP